MKNITTILLLLFGTVALYAQQGNPSAGGDVANATGSASYSVGQIGYTVATGSNGSVAQGVQQAFEFSTLGADNFPKINMEMKVYPNPTTSSLYLKIEDTTLKNLHYQLYDASGKLVKKDNIKSAETLIDLSTKTAGIYLLIVADASSKLKSFKIIKN